LLELDAVNCPITNQSLLTLFQQCRDLRELKVSHCHYLNDMAFTASALATTMTPKNTYYFDQMRALDLTGVSVTDRSVDVFTSAAPKIRNLILNKCINITDIGVGYITRLGKYLHYLHLGSCRQITDQSIENLTNKCTRIRYIDLASCSELQDSTVAALATLPKLKRIGLVKCDKITNNAILALTKQPRTSMTLERIHLSYCTRLTAPAISQLVIHCRRLTHLSLSYISAFQYKEFQRFCREPPEELTEDQRRTFCVFSGKNVDKLRAYFRSPEFLEDEHRRRLTLHTARHALTTRLDEITDNLYGVRITN
jgi:F-box and leucine-rich repeat protein GRR1